MCDPSYYCHGSRRYGEQRLVSAPGGGGEGDDKEGNGDPHTDTSFIRPLSTLILFHTHKKTRLRGGGGILVDSVDSVKQRHTQTSFLMIMNEISFFLGENSPSGDSLSVPKRPDRRRVKSNVATRSFLNWIFSSHRRR